MARKEEAKLQDKFINLLKKENILHIKTTGGMSYLPNGKGGFMPIKHKEGFADVIVFNGTICCEEENTNCPTFCKRGESTYFIEIKTDDGKLRDSQIEKFNQLTILGYDCYILRPKHWEQAKLEGKLSFENVMEKADRYYRGYEFSIKG